VNKNVYIKREEYDEALDRYYEVRGWNKEGVPSRKTLKRLGLDKIVG
jgi:aldehyde:ferredoxin oxidoreductase